MFFDGEDTDFDLWEDYLSDEEVIQSCQKNTRQRKIVCGIEAEEFLFDD